MLILRESLALCASPGVGRFNFGAITGPDQIALHGFLQIPGNLYGLPIEGLLPPLSGSADCPTGYPLTRSDQEAETRFIPVTIREGRNLSSLTITDHKRRQLHQEEDRYTR